VLARKAHSQQILSGIHSTTTITILINVTADHNPDLCPAAELWQDLGPQLFPLPNVSRMGMVIDTGVDTRQLNVLPQLAANQSITFSKDGNAPPDGQLGMGE
jgi:hypothetical protein